MNKFEICFLLAAVAMMFWMAFTMQRQSLHEKQMRSLSGVLDAHMKSLSAHAEHLQCHDELCKIFAEGIDSIRRSLQAMDLEGR